MDNRTASALARVIASPSKAEAELRSVLGEMLQGPAVVMEDDDSRCTRPRIWLGMDAATRERAMALLSLPSEPSGTLDREGSSESSGDKNE